MSMAIAKAHGQDQIVCIPSQDQHQHELHIWESEQPSEMVFLALHGGMSHAGDYQSVGEHFRNRSVTTVSFNLRGHGKEKFAHFDSYKRLLQDISDVLGWIERRYPSAPVFIVGHSMGGLLATCFALKKFKGHERVQAYILSSPYYLPIMNVSILKKFGIGLASLLKPSNKIEVEGVDDKLTRDDERTLQIKKEIEQSYRAQGITVKMAQQILKAQKLVRKKFAELDKEVLVLIAGDECLSDPNFTQKLLSKPKPDFVSTRYYPANQHENFNEINRIEIFGEMERWCRNILKSA